MCGIAGAVTVVGVDEADLQRMRDRLAHRGPDHAGSWTSLDGRVGLAHRRLAIVDLTPEANQPFVSGAIVLTFNGEIYNWRDLRSRLEAEGATFRTRSDTEVLVEAYRHWGERCVDHLSGMFAFALWDAERRSLFCARDRAGEKPFYYAEVNGAFVFASELKSLLAWPGFVRELDWTAVADFLTFGFVPDPKTIWQGASKLPPGHMLTVAADGSGRPRIKDVRSYWDFECAPDTTIDDWDERIRETLLHAAAEMANADVPVGAFLSGGVDSSAVTAALSRAGRRVGTYTIGFAEADYDERPFARTVASRYRTPHLEQTVDPSDAESVFCRTIPWHYDEPFNDYSYIPTYYVCREARRQITVALSGDGGDELFGGYGKYRRLAVRDELRHVLSHRSTRHVLVGAGGLLPERSAWRARLGAYASDPADLLTHMLATGLHPTRLRQAARGPLAAALEYHDPADVVRAHLSRAPVEEVGLVNAMRYLDLKLTLGAGILTKVDRASMAVSLEVRPVLLHRDLLALAGRIPPDQLASRRETKKVLKSALQPWLPEAILAREKMGFAAPLGRWLRGDLAHLTEPLRRPDSRVSSFVDRDYIRDTVDEHRDAGADFPLRLHSLLFLENWLATWS